MPDISHHRGPPPATDPSTLRPAAVRRHDLLAAITAGAAQFRAQPLLSAGFAAVFTVLGSLMFILLEAAGIAPVSLSLAGGFMLVGPALLAGFFALSDRLRHNEKATLGDIARGFRRMPRGGWVMSFVCALIFLIWITDAGILYGFMVGREPVGFMRLLRFEETVAGYVFYSAIMGAVLAFILFAVSAFSIPLLYDRRAHLVPAVVASVRAVFGRFGVVLSWAVLLAAVIMVSALVLPLLLITLPVMAYASREFYLRVYPPNTPPPPR
ncbi:DUF2189 domain-containing protein [Thauera aromatica]|nr:DUF2189 domain-containing protein [Thauera aromatica]MCK2125328.1 DUF2189 domain-containing protein [Thauera aromatica]